MVDIDAANQSITTVHNGLGTKQFHRLKWLISKRLRRQSIVCEHALGYRIRLEFSDLSASHIYFNRYEPEETEKIVKLVGPGMTVLDVGANIGYFTLLLAGRVGPSGRVHAFEPNPVLHNKLRENAALNPEYADGRIAFHREALGSYEGEAEFFCPIAGHEGVGGLRNTNRAPLSAVIRVPVQMLDAFVANEGITRLDFIKMDIEGGELDALRGAERTLRNLHPKLLFEAFEVNTEPYGYRVFEILSYLEQRDYIVKQAGMAPNFLATPK
jgi:FkbM family methyltransferase